MKRKWSNPERCVVDIGGLVDGVHRERRCSFPSISSDPPVCEGHAAQYACGRTLLLIDGTML